MIEPREKRIARFENGGMSEIADTIINSYANFLLPQIDILIGQKLYSFALVGIYAIGFTVSEKILGITKDHFKSFLEAVVDNESNQYAPIAGKIKLYRDVLMHQWFADSNYEFALDPTIDVCWKVEDGITLLNPVIFYQDFRKAFQAGGKIYDLSNTDANHDSELREKFIKGYKRKI